MNALIELKKSASFWWRCKQKCANNFNWDCSSVSEWYGSRTMYGFAEVFLPLLRTWAFFRWKFWDAFPLANHDVQRWKIVGRFSDRTSTFHLSTSFRWKIGFLVCLRYITLSFLPESICHHHPCWKYSSECVHDRRVQQRSWASFKPPVGYLKNPTM